MATLIDTLVAGLDLDTGDPSPLQHLIEQALAQLTDKAGVPGQLATAAQELEVFFSRVLGGSAALQQFASGVGNAGEAVRSFAGQSGLGEALHGVTTGFIQTAQAGVRQLQAALEPMATGTRQGSPLPVMAGARATPGALANNVPTPAGAGGQTGSSFTERVGGGLATVMAQVFGNPQAQGALDAQAVASGQVRGAPAIADAFVGMGWNRAQANGLAAKVLGQGGAGGADTRADNGSMQQLAVISQQLRTGSDSALGQRLAGASSAAQAGAILASGMAQPVPFGGLAAALSAAPQLLTDIRPGAALRAAASQPAGNSVQSETHIQTIEIHTQATDANAIARTIGPALSRNNLIHQAAGGDN